MTTPEWLELVDIRPDQSTDAWFIDVKIARHWSQLLAHNYEWPLYGTSDHSENETVDLELVVEVTRETG